MCDPKNEDGDDEVDEEEAAIAQHEQEEMDFIFEDEEMKKRLELAGNDETCLICNPDEYKGTGERVKIICKDSHSFHLDCFRAFQDRIRHCLNVVKCPKCHFID